MSTRTRTAVVTALTAGLIAAGAGSAAAAEPTYGPEWDPQPYGSEWDPQPYGPEWDPQPDQSNFAPGANPGTADLGDALYERFFGGLLG